MTPTSWLMVGQTVVFLAVCGFALWAARLIARAADDSALAAEDAGKAAQDAQRTAADVRQMRDMLQTWLDLQQSRVDRHRRQETPGAALSRGRIGTDTEEAEAVLTPQAIIDRGDGSHPAENSPGDNSRWHRGRHAKVTDPPWTAALRAAASRAGRER